MDNVQHISNSLFSLLDEWRVDKRIQYVVVYAILRSQKIRDRRLLRRLRNLFDSRVHYRILTRLRYNPVEDLLGRYYGGLNCIAVSETYCILDFVNNDWYLVGVNPETGKLFLRVVEPRWSLEHNEGYTIGDVKLYRTTDKVIRENVLNYNVDLDYEGLDRILGNNLDYTSARVQGEIVLELSTRNPIEAYMRELRDRLAFELSEIYHSIIRERIVNHLIAHGFIPSLRNNRVSLLVRPLDLERTDRAKELIANLIREGLERGLINDILEELGVKEYRVICECYCPSWRVRVKGREWDGNEYIDFYVNYEPGEIAVHIHIYITLLEKKVNELLEGYKPEFKKTTLTMGRHIINLECLPLSVTFKTEILGEERLVTVSNLPIVCRNKITLVHPEHGVREVPLPLPAMVGIRTTNMSPTHIEKTNTHRLTLLLKGR